jgi:hypothetical protein
MWTDQLHCHQASISIVKIKVTIQRNLKKAKKIEEKA